MNDSFYAFWPAQRRRRTRLPGAIAGCGCGRNTHQDAALEQHRGGMAKSGERGGENFALAAAKACEPESSGYLNNTGTEKALKSGDLEFRLGMAAQGYLRWG
jgi:hypothetical protein